LLQYHREGAFAYPESADSEVIWVRPNYRGVLFFDDFRLEKSARRAIRRHRLTVTANTDFVGVVRSCAGVPRKSDNTWMSEELIQVYLSLFEAGHGYSVECWDGGELVAGSFGLHVDGVVSGESMFHRQSNASKVALYYEIEMLRQNGFFWMDTQIVSPIMGTFGARLVSDEEFQVILDRAHTNSAASGHPPLDVSVIASIRLP
jgi:leucyl/phenylalanyl-tRNA--protein transferase